ncbi:MAG: hypothetical protein JRH10_03415 [Deltaproteobacteria bacterium]|nr:hypothetical protein [Deltaproteobacteria bacterium]MBW2448583.1 hypothetical protein [Deltaproteobacteria bacterium]
MPMLPLIDLLILLGWTSMMVGAVQKAFWITTSYTWKIVGLTPSDFLVAAGVCLLFALTLAARAWVKVNEPKMLTHGRRADAADPAGLEVGEWRNAPAERPEAATGR